VEGHAKLLQINRSSVAERCWNDTLVVPVNSGDNFEREFQIFHVPRQRTNLPQRIQRAARPGKMASARDAAFTRSAGSCTMALSRGCTALVRSRCACISSADEIFSPRMARAIPLAEVRRSSFMAEILKALL
jgi:hypothetical protein